VLALVEPEVRYISGVDEMTSTAAEGSASIRLEFTESTDMSQAMTDVETAVKAVNNLPEDSEEPTITRVGVLRFRSAKLAVFGAADEVGQTRLGQTYA
jgi:multidrug efflux pump subunit AcrB